MSDILLNVQGLFPISNQTKIPYLSNVLEDQNSIFLAISESHLNSDILDTEIAMKGFNILRQDRVERSHGRVILYMKDTYCSNLVATYSNSYCDFLIAKVPDKNLIVTLIYRPPNCPFNKFTENLNKIKIILPNYEDQCNLLLCDLNFPLIDNWDTENVLGKGWILVKIKVKDQIRARSTGNNFRWFKSHILFRIKN